MHDDERTGFVDQQDWDDFDGRDVWIWEPGEERFSEGYDESVEKTVREKYSKCAVSGKYRCTECWEEINRGDTVRFVHVRHEDGTEELLAFCSHECRNNYCDRNGIPW